MLPDNNIENTASSNSSNISDQEVENTLPVEQAKLDKAIDSIPLDIAEKDIIAKIIEAPTRSELQQQFDAFNINQSKKNALRIVKLNSLLGKVEDQAIARFEKRPDQVSNKELLEYINVISGQIDRAQKNVDTLSAAPTINVAAQKTDVTINVGNDLSRDSKERVMDAISALLKQIKAATDTQNDQIEVEFEDKTDDVEIPSASSESINDEE